MELPAPGLQPSAEVIDHTMPSTSHDLPRKWEIEKKPNTRITSHAPVHLAHKVSQCTVTQQTQRPERGSTARTQAGTAPDNCKYLANRTHGDRQKTMKRTHTHPHPAIFQHTHVSAYPNMTTDMLAQIHCTTLTMTMITRPVRLLCTLTCRKSQSAWVLAQFPVWLHRELSRCSCASFVPLGRSGPVPVAGMMMRFSHVKECRWSTVCCFCWFVVCCCFGLLEGQLLSFTDYHRTGARGYSKSARVPYAKRRLDPNQLSLTATSAQSWNLPRKRCRLV